MRRGWVLGLLALVGCSEDVIEPEPEPEPVPVFAEVCGTDGPHRLLPLVDGEHAYRLDPLPAGDRVLVSTFLVDPQVPLADLPPTLDTVLHVVGPCGEAPVEVARGLQRTSSYADLSLACGRDGHGAHVVDPTGALPPRAILDGWCPLRSTDAGLLTVEADAEQSHGSLVVLRDPADPQASPEALASGIRVARNTYFGPGGNSTTSLWASGMEAVALDEAGVVHRFDLQTGESTEELSGVREFRISSDGRSMIWQTLDPAEGDPQTPVGPVFVRDREAQTDAHLLNTHLEWTGNPFVGEYLVVRDDVQGLRLFVADGADGVVPVDLPPGTDYRGVLSEGRLWLSRRVDGVTEELQWSVGQAEPVVFARHQGTVTRRSDGVEIFETDDVAAPNEGSLHLVPWEGGEPVLLADRVHSGRGRLADGRILTLASPDATDHGALRLIEPGAGAWVQLDPLGYVQSPRLNNGDPFEGDIVFAVADPTGDGRGVYRASVPRG